MTPILKYTPWIASIDGSGSLVLFERFPILMLIGESVRQSAVSIGAVGVDLEQLSKSVLPLLPAAFPPDKSNPAGNTHLRSAD